MKGKITSGKFYTSYMMFLVVWIGTQLLAPIAAPHLGMASLLLGGGISACLFLCFFLTRGKQKILPAVLTITVFITWIYFTGWQKFFYFTEGYVTWIWGNPTGIENSYRYEFINICLWGIFFLVCSLIMEEFFLIKGLAGIGLICYLLFCMTAEKQIHKVTVCLIVLFLISGITEFLQGREIRKRMAVYLLPFFILYFIGIMVIPEKQEPYNWGFVKGLYMSARQTVVVLIQKTEDLFSGGRDGFGLQFTGFSEKGTIGGSAVNRDKDIMQFNLTRGKKMNLYLTGNVFDTFDGGNWKASGGKTEDDHMLDLLETLYAVKRYDDANSRNYIYEGEIRAYYTNIKTEYLFTPLKTKKVFSEGEWKGYLKEQGGQWTFHKKQGYGTGYQVLFYQMNLGQPFFAEMVEQESRYRYGEASREDLLKECEDSFADSFTGEISEKSLLKRAEEVKKQYAQAYGVSEAVDSLIYDMIGDSQSDYAKCKAIERALSGQDDFLYTYTLYPEQIPEEKEFLDYFLLESKEGYCTYFATAFVLMVRELGIPARYVQGFQVSDEKLGVEEVTVTSNMAHAWPEVYFEGVGWIPFEPTPGFGSGRYRFWNPVQPVSEENSPPSVYVPEKLPIQEETVQIYQDMIPEGQIKNVWKARGLVIVLVMAATGGLLIVMEYLLRKSRYRRYSLEEKMKEQVKENLRILKFIGYRLQQGETIGELRDRIIQADNDFSLSFITCFEQINYGNDEVTEEMIKAVLQEKNLLFKKIKDNGRWKYYRVRIKMLVAEGVRYGGTELHSQNRMKRI